MIRLYSFDSFAPTVQKNHIIFSDSDFVKMYVRASFI